MRLINRTKRGCQAEPDLPGFGIIPARERIGSDEISWLLGELSYGDIKGKIPEVAMIPFGATEPHNLHLPYATDTIEADTIAGMLCQRAQSQGASIVCLPTVPYGTETNQQGFPFAMNLMPSTVLAILRDLVASLEKTGIRKCVILNSHGGNAFKGMVRELFGQTSVHLFVINWYAIKEGYSEVFSAKEDHAARWRPASSCMPGRTWSIYRGRTRGPIAPFGLRRLKRDSLRSRALGIY